MATEQLYRWDETQVNETSRLLASVLMRDLVNSGGLVPVEPMFYVSFGHRPRCECQIDSCLTELRMVPNGD